MSTVKLDVSPGLLVLHEDKSTGRSLRSAIGAFVLIVVGLLLLGDGIWSRTISDDLLGAVVVAGGCAMGYLTFFANRLQSVDTRFDLTRRLMTIVRTMETGGQSETVAFDDIAALLCSRNRAPHRPTHTSVIALRTDRTTVNLVTGSRFQSDQIEAMVNTIRVATGLKAE